MPTTIQSEEFGFMNSVNIISLTSVSVAAVKMLPTATVSPPMYKQSRCPLVHPPKLQTPYCNLGTEAKN